MIDHASIAVCDLADSAGRYERVLSTLGLARLVNRASSVGFGKSYPELWLNARPGRQPSVAGSGSHLCLRATSEAAVREFFAVALASGFSSAGEPGLRAGAMNSYFGAFIEDRDGNRIETMFVPRN